MDEDERIIKKTELQIEFFKKCHEEGFTFSEMMDFNGYLNALMLYADRAIINVGAVGTSQPTA